MSEPTAALVLSLAGGFEHIVAPSGALSKSVLPRVAAMLDVMVISEVLAVHDAATFDRLFADEAKALGHDIRGADVLALLSGDLRPRVVAAFKACKVRFKVGCITNNAPTGKGAGMSSSSEKAQQIADVFGLFDHVIESSKAGVRKPDPRIYLMMCDALRVKPEACVYLDDLGINLKPAREMGMTTIKVLSEEQLLEDLARTVGMDVQV
jgi:putative hydrolase of the HAD superfamily